MHWSPCCSEKKRKVVVCKSDDADDDDDDDNNNHIPTSKVHFQLTRNITFSGVALPTDLYLITFTFHLCVSVFSIYVGKRWFWSELVSVLAFLKWEPWLLTLSILSSTTKSVGIPLKPFSALSRLLRLVF